MTVLTIRRRRKPTLAQRVMKWAGTSTLGNDSNPPEAEMLRYQTDRFDSIRKLRREDMPEIYRTRQEYLVFSANNDGMELWFGSGDKWFYSLSQGETRALFWWLLWEWYAKARWFGLRRPIYYWALHRHVKQLTHPPQDPR